MIMTAGHAKNDLLNPIAIVLHLWQFRDLIWLMSWREVQVRYKGSVAGLGWALIHPLFLLGVYTFVFSVIFNARWGIGADETRLSFALILFLGLITFGLFSEMVSSSPTLILSNVNYVKKVVFPLEILPVVRILSILINSHLSLFVLLVGLFLAGTEVRWTILFLPLIWLPVLFFSLGCGYFLSALGVFFRDLNATASIVTTLLFFASPIFYPISAVPSTYQNIVRLNPLAVFVEDARRLVFMGELPDGAGFFMWGVISVFLWIVGYWCFMRCKKAFADVI